MILYPNSYIPHMGLDPNIYVELQVCAKIARNSLHSPD